MTEISANVVRLFPTNLLLAGTADTGLSQKLKLPLRGRSQLQWRINSATSLTVSPKELARNHRTPSANSARSEPLGMPSEARTAARAPSVDAACPGQPAGRNRYPILIIAENNPVHFTLLKRALWKAGATARVWWAHDGPEALRIIAELEPHYAGICIVSEIHLAGYDGFELLRLVRARRSSACIKFAFLTGAFTEEDQKRACACGVDGFYSKEEGQIALVAAALQKLALDALAESSSKS